MTFRSLFLVVVAVLLVGCEREPVYPAGDNPCSPQARVVVDEAIDGDTVEVTFLEGERSGTTVSARLIGIDTPEVDHQDENHDCYALPAWQETIDLVQGLEAYVTFDAECNDDYGRSLVYLFRADDGLFVNRQLVAEGFARACPFAPNTTFASELGAVEAEAIDQGIGRWGEPCNGGPECFGGGS